MDDFVHSGILLSTLTGATRNGHGEPLFNERAVRISSGCDSASRVLILMVLYLVEHMSQPWKRAHPVACVTREWCWQSKRAAAPGGRPGGTARSGRGREEAEGNGADPLGTEGGEHLGMGGHGGPCGLSTRAESGNEVQRACPLARVWAGVRPSGGKSSDR